jgi:S-(hydroxymethyl)glutathione dehydrogenase / alcohol dehydrogenase
MKSSKKKPKAKRIREKRPISKPAKRQPMVAVPAALERYVGSNVRRARMKALVLTAVGRGFDFEDVDIAAPIGREVLIDVWASGLCHTDLLFATNPIFPTPAVFGHEISGIVAEIGPDVAQFRVGDHVVGSLAQSCGSCPRHQSGRSFQCQHPEATLRRPTDAPRLSREGQALYQGLGLGGFAERALVRENQLALIPKEMPFPQAALLGCGVVTGAGAVLNTASVAAAILS